MRAIQKPRLKKAKHPTFKSKATRRFAETAHRNIDQNKQFNHQTNQSNSCFVLLAQLLTVRNDPKTTGTYSERRNPFDFLCYELISFHFWSWSFYTGLFMSLRFIVYFLRPVKLKRVSEASPLLLSSHIPSVISRD